MSNSDFDATASMLGYIYQIRFGLYLALKKMSEVDDEDLFNISIERLDDIAFESIGNPVELLQTKFHGKAGNLTNRSSDIWKTIRIWAEGIRSGVFRLGAASFILVTTERAAVESIAYHLGSDLDKRSVTSALIALREIASTKGSDANQKGFDAFNALQPWEQEHLAESIYVIGKSPDLVRVRQMIINQLKMTTEKRHLDGFASRLEGAWFNRIIEEMSRDSGGSICLGELRSIIDDLRPQFLSTNLPNDFSAETPNEIDVAGDVRNFVQQLRLFNAPDSIIKQAVISYYRAYGQRNRWSKDGLLNPGELGSYDQRVYNEWEHQKSMVELNLEYSSSLDDQEFSRKLYAKCQDAGIVDIRRDFREPFLSRGSYQILSDEMRLGWHPFYFKMLAAKNDGVA